MPSDMLHWSMFVFFSLASFTLLAFLVTALVVYLKFREATGRHNRDALYASDKEERDYLLRSRNSEAPTSPTLRRIRENPFQLTPEEQRQNTIVDPDFYDKLSQQLNEEAKTTVYAGNPAEAIFNDLNASWPGIHLPSEPLHNSVRPKDPDTSSFFAPSDAEIWQKAYSPGIKREIQPDIERADNGMLQQEISTPPMQEEQGR